MNKQGKTQVSSKKVVEKNETTSELEALRRRVKELEGGEIETKIPLDELITVMSLLPYTLNLSTRERGQGKISKFERFGQTKRIMYSDLIDIIETNRSFMEAGYFIILDKRVLKAHGLDEAYEKILTKENILNILNGSSDCTELYLSCNPKQQDVIIGMLVEKLRDNPESVDLNMVDKIARVSKVNIIQKAEDARYILKKDVTEESEES